MSCKNKTSLNNSHLSNSNNKENKKDKENEKISNSPSIHNNNNSISMLPTPFLYRNLKKVKSSSNLNNNKNNLINLNSSHYSQYSLKKSHHNLYLSPNRNSYNNQNFKISDDNFMKKIFSNRHKHRIEKVSKILTYGKKTDSNTYSCLIFNDEITNYNKAFFYEIYDRKEIIKKFKFLDGNEESRDFINKVERLFVKFIRRLVEERNIHK
jgi:hypothetical protein